MTVLVETIDTDFFSLCYGFMGPYETFEMILRHDRLANEWVYILITSLDPSKEACFNNYVYKGNEYKTEFKVFNKTPKCLREYFGNKVISKTENNLMHYIAFNPVPYTAEHDLKIIDSSCVIDASDNMKFVIPYIGKCKLNGKEIKEKQFAIIDPLKSINIEINDSYSNIAVITRL